MLKEFPKFHTDHFPSVITSISIFLSDLSNVSYHLTKLLNLSADVCMIVLAPLLCHGALQGPPIIILPSLGDHHAGSGVMTEGVVLLIFPVFTGPPLPVLLQTFHRNNANSGVLSELSRRRSVVWSFHDAGCLSRLSSGEEEITHFYWSFLNTEIQSYIHWLTSSYPLLLL